MACRRSQFQKRSKSDAGRNQNRYAFAATPSPRIASCCTPLGLERVAPHSKKIDEASAQLQRNAKLLGVAARCNPLLLGVYCGRQSQLAAPITLGSSWRYMRGDSGGGLEAAWRKRQKPASDAGKPKSSWTFPARAAHHASFLARYHTRHDDKRLLHPSFIIAGGPFAFCSHDR